MNDAAATIIAASGPNTAAAKTVGSTEIETSVPLSNLHSAALGDRSDRREPEHGGGFPSPWVNASASSTTARTSSATW